MRILITDDHPVVRKGVVQIVSRHYPDCEVDEAADGRQTIEMIGKSDYNLILLDISLPDINGLDVLRQIKKLKPANVVVIMSILPEEHYAIKALKLGASGYLAKMSAPEELISAIQKVMEGGKYVSPSLSQHFANRITDDNFGKKALHETLSPREFQVMNMIVAGMKSKEIANKIFVSVKTVSTHRARLLKKMNMKSNAELVNYALQSYLFM
jgi:two-component system, NarL family, invasion response regulator UvrY